MGNVYFFPEHVQLFSAPPQIRGIVAILRFAGDIDAAAQRFNRNYPPATLEHNTNGCAYSSYIAGGKDNPMLFFGIHQKDEGGIVVIVSPNNSAIKSCLDHFLEQNRGMIRTLPPYAAFNFSRD